MVMQNGNFRLNNRPKQYKQGRFYLKPTVWEDMKVKHNWKNDRDDRGSISRFAEKIGVSRQYAQGITKGYTDCSAVVMFRIVRFLGLENDCWCRLFEIYPNEHNPIEQPTREIAAEKGVILW